MKDNRLEKSNLEKLHNQQIELAERMMGILDEDGQPMYSEDWVTQNIIGMDREVREKPE